jgi:hypothetical protein
MMETARPTPLAAAGSTGLGEVNAVKSILVSSPPNPYTADESDLAEAAADPALQLPAELMPSG